MYSNLTRIADISIPLQGEFQPASKFGTTTDVAKLASEILLILTSIAAALTIILIIIGGIKFVTSGGDQKKLASARATITYALIGFAVTVLAFVILRVVQFVVGANVAINV